MRRYWELSGTDPPRRMIRARRRAYRALRRRNQAVVQTVLLQEPESASRRRTIAHLATGTPTEILAFLDALPLIRYLARLTDLRPEIPTVWRDGRGAPDTLARMLATALATPDPLDAVLPLEGSPRTRRRREAVLTLLDALIERLEDRDDLRFLILWQFAGQTSVAVEHHLLDPHADWRTGLTLANFDSRDESATARLDSQPNEPVQTF